MKANKVQAKKLITDKFTKGRDKERRRDTGSGSSKERRERARESKSTNMNACKREQTEHSRQKEWVKGPELETTLALNKGKRLTYLQ